MMITHQPWARAVIEVLYSGGCPNHAPFVARLAALLAELGVDEPICEVRVETDAEARTLRFLGSPTLRVDGVDVEPGVSDRTGYALQCRLYPDGFPADGVRAALSGRRSRCRACVNGPTIRPCQAPTPTPLIMDFAADTPACRATKSMINAAWCWPRG